MFDFIKQSPLLWLILFLLVVSPSFLFGAFQVIAIIICVIFVIAIVGVLLLRQKIKKIQRDMNAGGRASNTGGFGAGSPFGSQFRSQQKSSGGGDVKVYPSATEKRVADDVGDYVEFEEIKVDKESK